MKIRMLLYKSIENLVSSDHSSFRRHTLWISIPFVQKVAARKLFRFQAKMWTAIIFMGVLQLPTFWINPCFALSSTNESLVESDEKVDLRFVTYYNLVGDVVYTRYEKPPDACNKIVKRANKPSYFQVMSHCFEERVRLLDRNKPNEMAVLEKMMRSDADLRKQGVWVLLLLLMQTTNMDLRLINVL
ncbi:unnamed protein product [Orchesella dallaii]|uniref:Uncharacterized protein n=1 Tax=Orchesella dallaii TaxID=48710 RepID=A0ABP1QD32_9HEXA